ncbi:MAG: hypothetical protein EA414_11455 [Arthrospira sp. PLM2.Bin9]|nr:hypothetical protein [Arthrospira sp. PLM2.Bin9]TVU53568.1 MAG: hypothetical protein EA414_11455 [Arthrospira sp. PLM2.Bin9]
MSNIKSPTQILMMAFPLFLAIPGVPNAVFNQSEVLSFPVKTESIFGGSENTSPYHLPLPEVQQRRPSECYDNGVC